MGGQTRHYVDAALRALTLGREDQSFLDAGWVAALLRNAPSSSRRRLALSILSLSPHYFYRRPEYDGLSHAEFVEREFERNRATREKLGECILGPNLEARQVVLDYGCGPGFLVQYVARFAETVYGVDISRASSNARESSMEPRMLHSFIQAVSTKSATRPSTWRTQLPSRNT